MRKYHIKTWGCQMNVYDSQRIAEVLEECNFTEAKDISEADLVILNTCHIREKATEKVFSEIGRLAILKKRRESIGKNLIIAVSGCVAQAEGEHLQKRAPVVDLVFGPQTWHRLPKMLQQLEDNVKSCDTDFPVEEKFEQLPSHMSKSRIVNGSAFIAIQEGCDKFCTYCVVPYTRGAEYSRPVWQVLNEITQLAMSGAKEVTLLGQNVNAYHGADHLGKEVTLGHLIEKVAEIKGIERIRYVTSYPAEVTDDLIEAHRDVKELMPFLHLPIQSGSNKVLKDMNRRHTREEYLKLVEKISKARPDIAYSSDFIVGFPGETDKEFQESLDIIEKVGFIQSFSFMYSPRPGTPAALRDDQVEESVKAERLQILQQLLEEKQIAFNKSVIDSKFDVLFDRLGKYEGQVVGKSPYMQAVYLDNADSNILGEVKTLKIVDGLQNCLKGELIL